MFSVYDGIYAYAKKANSALYISSKTAIFNNPDNQIFTPKAKNVLVRQYSAGAGGNYDRRKGWMTSYGVGEGVSWKAYRADNDRAKILRVDAPDELQSYANGMTPSIELLNSDYFNNWLPREMDAYNLSKWFGQIPEENKIVSGSEVAGATVDITPENILYTINQFDRLVFNSGYDRDCVLFMNSQCYASFISAIQNKMGLANNVLMERSAEIVIDTGMGDLIKGRDTSIKVHINFEVYGRFLIVRVPDDRMVSNIIMLSGNPDDAGQEQGGFIVDSTNTDFREVYMMAIPIEAAFTNVRYLIENFLYPSYLQTGPYTNIDLEAMNRRMFHNVEVANAGINQKFNAFEYDTRCIYGGSLFDNRKRNCFALCGEKGGNTAVTGITLTAKGGTAEVNVDGELQLEVAVEPAAATNKTVAYGVTPGTGEATVDESGMLRGVKEGTVTAYANATDGSGVRGDLEVHVKKMIKTI